MIPNIMIPDPLVDFLRHRPNTHMYMGIINPLCRIYITYK